MSVYKHENSPFYHYDFQYNRRRFHGSTGEATRPAAKRVEAAERKAVLVAEALEQHNRAAGKRTIRPMTLVEVAAQYWAQVAARQKRSDQVMWSLNWLTAYFGDDKLITEIDGAEISKMVAKRGGEKVMNVAVARGLKADKRRQKTVKRKPIKEVSAARVNRSATEPLRKVLYFARDVLGQHIQPIQWKHYRLKEPADRIRMMKAEQEALILPALSEKYRPLVYVKKRIGPRIFELLKMKWSDIDWSAPRVEIEGKGGSRKSIPLPTDVRDVLWALPRRHERVFIHEDGSPMTYSAVSSAWRRACEKAGVTDLTVHDLRHTAATNLLKVTNLKNVQRMLRHADIRSTLRYAHAGDRDLLEALEISAKSSAPATQIPEQKAKTVASS